MHFGVVFALLKKENPLDNAGFGLGVSALYDCLNLIGPPTHNRSPQFLYHFRFLTPCYVIFIVF
jgi:hypothetical protein